MKKTFASTIIICCILLLSGCSGNTASLSMPAENAVSDDKYDDKADDEVVTDNDAADASTSTLAADSAPVPDASVSAAPVPDASASATSVPDAATPDAVTHDAASKSASDDEYDGKVDGEAVTDGAATDITSTSDASASATSVPDAATPDAVTHDAATASVSGVEYDDKADDEVVTDNAPKIEESWASILVNPDHYLPENYSVELSEFYGGYIDSRIYDIADQMFCDAEADGIDFKLSSGYRSRATQEKLYEKKVQSFIDKGYSREESEVKAATITARPDTSEHQTGLALDIVSRSYPIMDAGFADTKAFDWLEKHAADYGFIMRYAKEKQKYTGVIYEPWHWRYVGTETAYALLESGDCYEEYLEKTR